MAREKKHNDPRTVIFSCAAVRKGGELVADEIQIPVDLITRDEKGKVVYPGLETAREKCAVAFQEKHRIKPLYISPIAYTPFHRLGKVVANTSNVSVPAEQVNYMNQKFSGILAGWKVVGHGLKACKSVSGEAFKDNEVIQVFQMPEPVTTGDDGKKPPKPRLNETKLVRASGLENLSEMK